LQIDLCGIVVVVGNYGSGKTEVSINLAVHARKAGLEVRIADLDLVNPYFRTREAEQMLTGFGVNVILPGREYLHADLPILPPAVAGMIRRPDGLTILDVGGDDAGATVLASLAEVFNGKKVHMLMVVNPRRPATSTVAGCMKMRKQIEGASRMTITGLIGNANLIDETGPEDIYSGYEFVRTLSSQSELPLSFITVDRMLLPAIDLTRLVCPVLPIVRQLVPPWKQAGNL
jgi:hypothetical protein